MFLEQVQLMKCKKDLPLKALTVLFKCIDNVHNVQTYSYHFSTGLNVH